MKKPEPARNNKRTPKRPFAAAFQRGQGPKYQPQTQAQRDALAKIDGRSLIFKLLVPEKGYAAPRKIALSMGVAEIEFSGLEREINKESKIKSRREEAAYRQGHKDGRGPKLYKGQTTWGDLIGRARQEGRAQGKQELAAELQKRIRAL